MSLSVLSSEEVAALRAAFARYDDDGSGSIDRDELAAALEEMGQDVTDAMIDDLMNTVDEDGSGLIDFDEFASIFVNQLKQTEMGGAEVLDAFVALGGNADESGQISATKLRAIVREFQLTIDIEALIREVDADNSGFIDYEEFTALLRGDDADAADLERRFR